MDSCIPISEKLPEESFGSSPDSGSPRPSKRIPKLSNESSNPEKEYVVTTHKGSNPLIHAVAMCEEKNSTWKKDMEDATVFLEGYGGKEGTSFFGIFAGFHGRSSAVMSSRELPVLVLEQLSKQDPTFSLEKDHADLLSGFDALFQRECTPHPSQAQNTLTTQENLTKVEQVNQAFTTAFCKMDRILGLGRNETSKIRWSGCTALVCLIDSNASSEGKEQGTGLESGAANTQTLTSQESQSGRILIANCGNVHAVLYKQGRGFRLTKDHSTSNPKERKRIIRNGGSISVNQQHGLVEGLTRATRGLGHYGDRKLKKSVIPVPYFVSLPMDPSFQLLVLASSGLWDVLDAQAVAEIALTIIEMSQKSSMRKTLNVIQPSEEQLSVLDAQICAQSRQESSIFNKQDLSRVVDEDNPPLGLDIPEILWEEASETQNKKESERQIFPSVSKQDSQLNEEETITNCPRNLMIDYEHLAADICREIVDAAVVSGSKENISVMVILLQGLDVPSENTLSKVT